MKKILLALLVIPAWALAASQPQTVVCPSVAEVNRAFHHCKINADRSTCHARVENTEWVLDSPVEEIYGGEHEFKGFSGFEAAEVLSGNVVCKYTSSPESPKMGWIVGSRYEIGQHCHLNNAKYVLGVSSCQANNPQQCKITCP